MNKEEIEKTYFTPSVETEKSYQEQVNKVLGDKNIQINTFIDMGKLPYVYNAIGISDKKLKTNKRAILKAIGKIGPNIHNVPRDIINNLISCVYNPAAIFKSLSMSQNPNGYIAVFDADVNGNPIIAILSPSKIDNGYTFIPTIYGKDNFKRFMGETAKENKILYIENVSSKLWGRLQLPPLHNQSSDYTILTKTDIVNKLSEEKEPEIGI